MGIVKTQGIKSFVLMVFGSILSYFYALILAPLCFSEEEIGVVKIILDSASLIAPFAAFGTTVINIKSSHEYENKGTFNGFLIFLLILGNLITVSFLLLQAYFRQDSFLSGLSNAGIFPIPFIILIFLCSVLNFTTSICLISYKTAIINFVTNPFVRMCLAFFALAYYYFEINFNLIQIIIPIIFIISIIILIIEGTRNYKFNFDLNFQTLKNKRKIIISGIIYMLSNSGIIMILRLQSISMVNNMALAGIVALFISISNLVDLPGNAITQILAPLSAKLLNENNIKELNLLYKKSTLNILLSCGYICCITYGLSITIIKLIPNNQNYILGLELVLAFCLAKVIHHSFEAAATILRFSKFYYFNLFITTFLIIYILGYSYYFPFNVERIKFITISSVSVTVFINVIIVYFKYKIHPFSSDVFKSAFLIIAILFLGKFLNHEFFFNILADLTIKGLVITSLFLASIYILNIQSDLRLSMEKLIKKIL